MIITKTKTGYKITLDLFPTPFLNTNCIVNSPRKFDIKIDNKFGINIPATGNLKSNQIEILLDGIVMANTLKKKEIIFNNEK